jgi:SynChlorMet cassette protein ScmD
MTEIQNPKQKIIANPNIVLREEFENKAFLYDPDTGDTFPLNPAGVLIWKHLDGNHTVDALIDKIEQHFDNVPESAMGHIRDFIEALSEKGFVGK